MSVVMTEEQNRAVSSRGKVIVSASAGSGKTFVMIERLVTLICEGVDLSSVLAVTYTRKAAAQMREKLRARLIEEIGRCEGKKRARLKEQLTFLPSADICTVHVFCSRLLRTYFYLADLDPAFRILSAEETEGKTLLTRALDEAFEEAYQRGGASFRSLLSVYFRKNRDEFLRGMVRKLYLQIRGIGNYRQLLSHAEEYGKFEEIQETLLEDFRFRAQVCMRNAEEAGEWFAKNDARGVKLCSELRHACKELADAASLEEMKKCAAERLKVSAKPSSTKAEGELLRRLTRLGTLSALVKALYAEIGELAPTETERVRWKDAHARSGALASLILALDDAYARLKREAGALDYNDLEYFALQILKDGQVLDAVRKKYVCLFVDEYQDVNPVQEELLALLGKDADVFYVGDAKQAIYAFRGSRSDFFLKKAGTFPVSLCLSENFRSASAVLDVVNRVFSHAMTAETSGISYREEAFMRGGRRYLDHAGKVEFHRIPKTNRKYDPPKEIYSVLHDSADKEDELAQEVIRLVGREVGSEWFDADAGMTKRVEYGDIAILVRKKMGDAERIVRTLSEHNIPVTTTAQVNVCEFWEARLLIDWLSFLDNTEQDIPRAGAMLSLIGGFTEADLASIRARFPSQYTFREACAQYAGTVRDDLAEKLRAFDERTEAYRVLSAVRTAQEMIQFLLSEGLEAEIAAKQDGKKRLQRVRRLADSAEGSVNDFLHSLAVSGYQVDFSESGGENAVKVLTMHSAKGLEFPVVLLANLDAPFHDAEREEVVFSEQFLFAPKSFDTDKKLVYGNDLRRASAICLGREEARGELNLLYVAMTRAKYRLHLFFRDRSEAISPQFAKCMQDFFLLPEFDGFFAEPQAQADAPLARNAFVYRPDSACEEEILSVYEREYPFRESALLPVKSSATDLIRRQAEGNFRGSETREAGGADAQTGIAYHAFLRYVRFGCSVHEELKRMKEGGLLSAQQLELLDENQLEKILSMPSFASVAGKEVRREQTFLCRLPANETLCGCGCQDEIVFQGAIDLLTEEADGWLILDYKFSFHDEERLRADYAPQISLYRKAVSKITGTEESKIKARILNIMLMREIEM